MKALHFFPQESLRLRTRTDHSDGIQYAIGRQRLNFVIADASLQSVIWIHESVTLRLVVDRLSVSRRSRHEA